MPAEPSQGWLQKIFGGKDKDTPNEKAARKGRRKKAREQAVKGYKREGGLLEKLKKNLRRGKEAIEDM